MNGTRSIQVLIDGTSLNVEDSVNSKILCEPLNDIQSAPSVIIPAMKSPNSRESHYRFVWHKSTPKYWLAPLDGIHYFSVILSQCSSLSVYVRSQNFCRPLPLVTLTLTEMLTFITWPISYHSHPLSSLVVCLSLGILWEWMRMQTPAKSFLSLLLRAGDVHLGGHLLPGWRPSKVISVPWIWSCMKPENWLRINLSGDWCLCVALRTRSGACY